ncbi:DUF4169 family protein [Thetidibacter halocola]|uniref:DUF4169 family protein n=1 Tax=Thetidibacter halocola TaxID=2827239 RepID=A0A8J8B9Q8_9RHOB|nr:DUF4169 family protein [Thetidibacter halocola]MBS0124443.1 DUF4169 family protein [Thetidibacter halocola]
MSQPVNLNRFRKQKARDDKRRTGDENAARHGLTKAERALEKARREKAERDLDGHHKE